MEILTRRDLASVWLEMGVHEFTMANNFISFVTERESKICILVIALEFLRFVLAEGLSFPWAVVKSIGLRRYILVQRMVPGSIVDFEAGTAKQFVRVIRSLRSP